jgi:hypothetical protein
VALVLLGISAAGAWGPVGLGVLVPLALVALWVWARAIPALWLSARMLTTRVGLTCLRASRLLPDDLVREVCRMVDLVRGRLDAVAPGMESGTCVVWVVGTWQEASVLRHAMALGLGRLGGPACPVVEREVWSAPEKVIACLSRDVARNAVTSLTPRIRPFLRTGLLEYFRVCCATPEGPERQAAFHHEVALARLSPPPRPLAELVVWGGGDPSHAALARSFTAFLMGRYGWRAYLRVLALADRRDPLAALAEAMNRDTRELEGRWRLFLESGLASFRSSREAAPCAPPA